MCHFTFQAMPCYMYSNPDYNCVCHHTQLALLIKKKKKGVGDPNSDRHACTANIPLTKLSSQPLFYLGR